MSLVCEEGLSLLEVDEALSHVSTSLKVDTYGNRMSWKKEALLKSSIDDLLDERIELMRKRVDTLVQ